MTSCCPIRHRRSSTEFEKLDNSNDLCAIGNCKICMLASMDPLRIILMFSMVATLLLMLIAERNRPAREFPSYRGWIWIGIGVMVFFVGLANTWSLVVPKEWLREHRLLRWRAIGA